jgi:hypothetical protein
MVFASIDMGRAHGALVSGLLELAALTELTAARRQRPIAIV